MKTLRTLFAVYIVGMLLFLATGLLPISAQTTIANNAADMSGKIVMVADSATGRTVTNLFTFDRGAAVPFAIGASSLKVTGLDADKLDGLDSTRFTWVESTTTSTGTQNDFAVTSGQHTVIRANNATALTITGFTAGVAGQRIRVISIGAGDVFFDDQGAGSTAANRIICFATSADTPIAAGSGSAEFVYDATTARWRLIQHQQGNWITPTFAAGNWTAATGTWTVDSADAVTDMYYLDGRRLSWIVAVTNSDVSATPTSLSRTLYGYTATKRSDGFQYYSDAAGTAAGGIATINAAGTTIGFVKFTGNFTATAADNTSVLGQGAVQVN